MHAVFRRHPRLWIAVGVGVACFCALPPGLSPISRLLVAWNCGVAVFLTTIYGWMQGLTAEQICRRYIEEDNSARFILVFVTFAALLSVVAIVEPLATLRQVGGWVRVAHMALAAFTLMNSWVLVPVMFTTHYADMFYSAAQDERPLAFPNTPQPVFWDFAYFSFTIAAACQTSDVSTNGAGIRQVVIAQTIVSFLFNASILGFAINVTAGLIGGP